MSQETQCEPAASTLMGKRKLSVYGAAPENIPAGRHHKPANTSYLEDTVSRLKTESFELRKQVRSIFCLEISYLRVTYYLLVPQVLVSIAESQVE